MIRLHYSIPQNRKDTMTTETLIMMAEYYKHNEMPLPVDIQARLHAVGIDTQKYQHN